MQKAVKYEIPAIVLGANGTGLATARCLSDAGIPVHMASLYANDIGRRSRRVRVIPLEHLAGDEGALAGWLEEYARRLGNRPVVLPTGDHLALMIARHRERLTPVCRHATTDIRELSAIVSKEQLYRLAEKAGLPTPPMLIEPDIDRLQHWCREIPPPYFVKPWYSGIESSALKQKNLLFRDAGTLQTYARSKGMRSLIVQQYIGDGDGSIFDCYGLCRDDGSPICMASHKRIRHYPPGRGATSYGEIPGFGKAGEETVLFEQTRKLLAVAPFHGIFGIEWMRSSRDGSFYLIDFNARPFSSIGHLKDCGANLPWLAYLELTGDLPADTPVYATVRHLYWIDLLNDSRSFVELHQQGRLGWSSWLGDVARARSSAYWRASDPAPALARFLAWTRITATYLSKAARR